MDVKIEIRDTDNSVIGVLDVGSDVSFPLSLTKSIASLNNLTTRSGTFSKTFKIPATKANNQLLTHLYSANQRNVKNMKDKKDALVYVDGVIVERGYIKIQNADIGNKPENYTFKFFGNNLDWIRQIGELKLNGINFNNNTQTFSRTQIQNSWSATYDDGSDHIYPYINYGQTTVWRGSEVEDMRPALRWRSIITRMINQVGYNLESDFMRTGKFNQLIFPYVGNRFRKNFSLDFAKFRAENTLNITYPLPFATPVTLLFVDDFTSPNFDNGGNYAAPSSKYTVPQTGKYKYDFNLTVEPTNNSAIFGQPIRIELRTASDIKAFRAFVLTSSTTVVGDTGFIRMEKNEVLFMVAIAIVPDEIKVTADSYIKAEMSEELTDGNTYDFTDVLPDIPCIDLLNDLTRAFNLYWRTNNATKTIFVEPRDTFYKPISEAVNATRILDMSKTPKLSFISNYKRELEFLYANDPNDEFVKARNEKQEDTLFAYVHTFPDRFIEGRQTFPMKTVAPTYWIRDELGTTSDNKPFTARMWNKANVDGSPPPASFDFNPRILNFKNATQTDLDGNSLRWRWFGEKSQIPFALPHTVDNISVPFNLSFGGSDGLIATYYAKSLSLIEDGIRLEAHVNLNPSSFNIDIRTPLYLSSPAELSGYWIIDTIHDWSPTKEGTTKITLLKFFNLNPVDIDTGQTSIDSSPIEALDIKKDLISVGGGTDDNTEQPQNRGIPSLVLNNGTGNQASKDSGSIAAGQGCKSPGENQSAVGRYPATNSTDQYRIGAGTGDNDRLTALSIDENGDAQFYGGGMSIVNSKGEIVPLFVESGGKIKRMYLKD